MLEILQKVAGIIPFTYFAENFRRVALMGFSIIRFLVRIFLKLCILAIVYFGVAVGLSNYWREKQCLGNRQGVKREMK